MKLLIMHPSPVSSYFLTLMSVYTPQHHTLKNLIPFPQGWMTKFHTCTKQSGKIMVSYILTFILPDRKKNDSELNAIK
jgi:hypothetical protein